MSTPTPNGNREHAYVPDSALATDLYELTMLQAYWRESMFDTAVFSLFPWRLPNNRNYLVACGLAEVLNYLENLHFRPDEIDYLHSLGTFSEDFLVWLKDFRFTGNVYAMAEGTPFFPLEPVLEIEAPMPQAQLVETFVMNQIHIQTVLATKGARVMQAADGRPVFDFGLRRAHGLDAGLKGARAYHVAGLSGTSHTQAGQIYGMPVTGTLAHSYIQAHGSEMDAMRRFTECYPDTILLLDTYDAMAGVDKVIALAKEMGDAFRIKAVRLDSGNLPELTRQTREKLDKAGLSQVGIVLSGGLDEYAISDLLAQGTPVDSFGVGSRMAVSSDAPGIDLSYKLAAYAGEGRVKNAGKKQSYPGRKQVFRMTENGKALGDVVARADEDCPGRPLLQQVMRDGKILPGLPDHHQARQNFAEEKKLLPGELLSLTGSAHYPVTISQALEETRRQILQRAKS
ncbi:MAG: nicotinate phosphoribosyltransferase [Desulfovibrio sp.]|uniref:nicotinate phosphoribosyltransferase n=1 Tax=Desulfovibrio sp. 7SRBS1 TaxID=3378064 RepID=UPI003B3E0E5A